MKEQLLKIVGVTVTISIVFHRGTCLASQLVLAHVHFCMLTNDLCLAAFLIGSLPPVNSSGAVESRMDIFDDAALSVLEGKSQIKFIFDVFVLLAYSL